MSPARCVTVTSLPNESLMHNVTYAFEFCVLNSSASVLSPSACVAKSVIVYTGYVEVLAYKLSHFYFGDKIIADCFSFTARFLRLN